MEQFFVNIIVLFSITRIIVSEESSLKAWEYCEGEAFEPQCNVGEVILMQSALYGRMSLGRCLPTDYGNMGCQSDVMPQFDHECSGRVTCEVLATNAHIEADGGCLKGLLKYLQAQYKCVQALGIDSQCASQSIVLEAKHNGYVTDLQLNQACLTPNKVLNLRVKDGQVMNISMINLHGSRINDEIYGTIKDKMANKEVVIESGSRDTHLLQSSSNELELKLTQSNDAQNRFMLHVAVFGCPSMPPPEGAWMTRDGDVMEIGCHSGSKTWSLRCQENQWVGAIGQCGNTPGAPKQDIEAVKDVDTSEELSLNALLFGICSLVILMSAVIFLIGVCLLKRKLQAPKYTLPADQYAIWGGCANETVGENNFHTLLNPLPSDRQLTHLSHRNGSEPGYKSLHVAQGPNAAIMSNAENNGVESLPAYMNTAESETSGSVKYYVLEDAKGNL